MIRQRLLPLALAVLLVIAFTACSSNGFDGERVDNTDGPRRRPSHRGPPPTTHRRFDLRVSRPDSSSSVTAPRFSTTCRPRPRLGSLHGGWAAGCTTPRWAMVRSRTRPITSARERLLRRRPRPPPASFSGTNTQEVGVDEGDIVETDGEYVYVANTDGLRVVSVYGTGVVAEPELPRGSHQLLLDGGRLLVVTSSWSGSPDTVVSLYDVADPAIPHCCGARISRATSLPLARSTGRPARDLDLLRSASALRPAGPASASTRTRLWPATRK